MMCTCKNNKQTKKMDQNTRNNKTLRLSDGTLRNQKMFDYSALPWKANHTHTLKMKATTGRPMKRRPRESRGGKKRKPTEKIRCLYT